MSRAYTTHHGKRVSRAHSQMLKAYERKIGHDLYINQGARTILEQTRFWLNYLRTGWPLAARPWGGAPHIKWRREHHALDINDGVVDGVADFYRDHGVPVAFNVPNEPWHMDTLDESKLIAAGAKLEGYPTLRKGSKGPSVKHAQVLLRMAKDPKGKHYLPVRWHAHKSYTLFVRRAVRRFQRDHGLTVDGVVGPGTWAALKKAAKS